MVLDDLLALTGASGQAVTADAVSTNTYDAGNTTPKRNIAGGTPVAIVVCITAIGTTSGSTKLQAIMSAAAALTAPVIVGEVDLATADIAAGKAYVIPISTGLAPLRYWGLNHDITGTVDYTVFAWIVPRSTGAVLAQFYARGYTFDIS